MLYKKDVILQLIIGTISAFIILLISFHLLLEPFKKVESELNIIEKNVISKNWTIVNKSLNKVYNLWDKYEILLRILNAREVNDDFILHLDQCKLLAKYKDDRIIEYVSILQDDVKDMMHVIPNP